MVLQYMAVAVAVALAALGVSVSTARSDDIPTLDVNPVCRGIAMQGELEAGLQRTSFQQCVQSEQSVREEIKKEWSTFSTADKTHCVALAKTGGESSYTELLTCMEMARDVRKLHSEADKSSAAVSEGLPAPVGHRQPTEQSVPSTPTPTPPALAATAPRPSLTNEPPNTGADSTLKELQRVKSDALNARTDAQNARTSEAMVRGKLASTEADLQRAKQELQRTKDEAGRATKEAEQAKDDAQSAREAQARAENKLADAEAARTAAEERQRASESAKKSETGVSTSLPSWLRSLFGRKPSNP